MFRSLLALTAAVLIAAPASATAQQTPDSEDWTLTRFADRNTLVATLPFSNGITLVARCTNNVFDVMLLGLPEAGGRGISRQLALLIGDETDEKPYAWTIGANRTTAFSRNPAMTARELAKGGKLQIIVPRNGDTPRSRYIMELGPSGSAIEQTLTDCGRPLVDPRDNDLDGDGEGLPTGIIWARAPRPEFPDPVNDRSPRTGYVTMSCLVTAGGRAEDCQIESEQPAGYNLGRSVLDAMRSARLGQSDEARAAGRPFEGRMILFTVEFRLQ